MGQYLASCYAPATKRAYDYHRKCYVKFCTTLGVPLTPASSTTLCLYAAFLARRLTYSSVKVYMNIVRIVHLERQLPNPLTDFKLSCVLQGIRRIKGDAKNQKLPITTGILLDILKFLDLSNPSHCAVWAASLLLFYGMLRKSNVLPVSEKTFDHQKHLRRRDVKLESTKVQLLIRWSKTIQFQERQRILPIPRIPGHPLCPVAAVFHYFRVTPECPQDGPAFGSLTSTTFLRTIKDALATSGYDTAAYATHSFRRGGATFAHQSGMSAESIRIIGDWKSACFREYIFESNEHVAQLMAIMTEKVTKMK